MIEQITKRIVSISKDDETLHKYLNKNYTLTQAISKCLFKIHLYYDEGQFDIVELKSCYHIVINMGVRWK